MVIYCIAFTSRWSFFKKGVLLKFCIVLNSFLLSVQSCRILNFSRTPILKNGDSSRYCQKNSLKQPVLFYWYLSRRNYSKVLLTNFVNNIRLSLRYKICVRFFSRQNFLINGHSFRYIIFR